MKRWERVALTCVLGTGIFFGVGGMAPHSFATLQPVSVAEAAADTWLASDGSTQSVSYTHLTLPTILLV